MDAVQALGQDHAWEDAGRQERGAADENQMVVRTPLGSMAAVIDR